MPGDRRVRAAARVALIDTNGFVTRQPWAATTSELPVLNLRTRSIAG
ncbi:MAG TPA: hypothetical protein VGD71_00720 [Kribbella sp.]